MVLLTEREKTDMSDTDVIVSWRLQPTARTVGSERKREK
jgi:hypothetical protein